MGVHALFSLYALASANIWMKYATSSGKYVRIREINIREYVSRVIFAKISSLEMSYMYTILYRYCALNWHSSYDA